MFIVIFKRDIYCGAIGFISPEEIIFSVPIRILQKKNNEKKKKVNDFYANFIIFFSIKEMSPNLST